MTQPIFLLKVFSVLCVPHKREEKFCIPFRFFNVRLASLSCGQNTGFRRIKRRNPVFLYTENRRFYVKSVKAGTKTGIKNRSKTWKNLCLSLALVSLVLSEVSIQGSRNGTEETDEVAYAYLAYAPRKRQRLLYLHPSRRFSSPV